MISTKLPRPILFIWENFGPLHVDRCDAVAKYFTDRQVIGIEILGRSTEYDWVSETGSFFQKITISTSNKKSSFLFASIIASIFRHRPEAVFFCHYQKPEIFVSALISRIVGIKTFTMNDSKFDDYARSLWREALKSFWFLPYKGALAASRRSVDYLRFLGVPRQRIASGYDAVSISRIRRLAAAPAAPEGAPFADRHLTIVARLLPKKNIALALQGLAICAQAGPIRRLIICGSGPLEHELKQLTEDLGLSSHVDFRGFVQTEEVCRVLATTLALILPSTEEQFGQVIPEALAMGVPVLVSDNCGARDHLVETGVNGFIFEPTNAAGLAFFIDLISSNESLWRSMATAAGRISERGDVDGFVQGVSRLLEGSAVP